MRRTVRLNERCRLLMSDNRWWTIPDMAKALGCTECGASARIRDQRKAKFGDHKVVKRFRGGAFEYRMLSGNERRGIIDGAGFSEKVIGYAE